MRRGVKIGIWSLVGILTVSGGLALVSTLYFNSKNSSNNDSNNQKPNDNNTNKPNDNNGNNGPTTPPSNDNNNNNDNSNSDNNGNIDKPTKPENPEPTPPKPEEPKPPANPDKPTNPDKPINPDKPTNPPSNGEDNNDTTGQTIQTKFKLDEVFDKYNYVKKTTNYQDYFKNNKLTFDESKIKIVTYDIFKPMIIKAMNIDLTKNTLKINIYYRLNQDSTELKLQVKWGIISNNSLISLEKKYYDNIYIKLR